MGPPEAAPAVNLSEKSVEKIEVVPTAAQLAWEMNCRRLILVLMREWVWG